MSYKDRIDNNNIDLQEILNTINNLPEGSEEGEIETCTIEVSLKCVGAITIISYTAMENNKLTPRYSIDVNLNTEHANLQNVVQNCPIVIYYDSAFSTIEMTSTITKASETSVGDGGGDFGDEYLVGVFIPSGNGSISFDL